MSTQEHSRPTFYEIQFSLGDLELEVIEAALLEVGASSITLVNHGDEPVLEPGLGEVKLWSDTWVRALFETTFDALEVLERLSTLSANLRLGRNIAANARIHAVQNRDWERVWLQDWKSMRFGRRLWVCPTAAAAPDDPDAVIVRLDPGLAFGTGAHPTTALCLQFLESLPLSGRSVIDYGCGSGILAIAALKMGAAHVVAVDSDPQALLATRENAARNGVGAAIVVQGIAERLPPANCVVANILAGPLIELAGLLTDACAAGGDLLLSGLLEKQAYEVKAAYSSGFERVRVVVRDDWCCIHARRSG